MQYRREARFVLRDPRRLDLPPREAIRKQLRILAGLAGAHEVSVWTPDGNGRVRCRAHADGRPSGGLHAAARAVLMGRGPTPPGPRRAIVAVPIGLAGSPVAALAARTRPGGAAEALALLEEAAPLLGLALERERLLDGAERRLARFGLDLHDGPAQEVAGLLSDLRLFRSQLESGSVDSDRFPALCGRVDDLEARVLTLESSLRELALTASRPAVLRAPIAELLRAETRAFARATGVEPELRISGPVSRATASQRMALLRVIQESLSNVRKHAGARSVSVSVEALAGRIEAVILDDGCGFDVGRAMSLAARRDRLGLAGIVERARLLGGRCEVSSRLGGPTRVSVALPR